MSYFVVISDKDKVPNFVFWMKKTDRAYVILKELVEASEHKLTAPAVKSLNYEAFLKVASQSMLTYSLSNPSLETPKTLVEVAQIVMHLVDHKVIDEKLVGHELKTRHQVLLNEQTALELSGKRLTTARYYTFDNLLFKIFFSKNNEYFIH